MQSLAVAMAEANNQQAEFALSGFQQHLNICAFEIQSVIASKVKRMLKAYVRRKYERKANQFMGDAGITPVEDSDEFRKWLWVYFSMTDTCESWNGVKCNLESYIKLEADQYKEKMIDAQMKGQKKDVATYHRLKGEAMDTAEMLLSEANSVELDHRIPNGFFDAMLDVIARRMKSLETKSYPDKDADIELLEELKVECGG